LNRQKSNLPVVIDGQCDAVQFEIMHSDTKWKKKWREGVVFCRPMCGKTEKQQGNWEARADHSLNKFRVRAFWMLLIFGRDAAQSLSILKLYGAKRRAVCIYRVSGRNL